MFRVFQLFAIACFVPCVFAHTTQNCESQLVRPASQLSYAASDLEGLFLHFVDMVQSIPKVEQSRQEYFVRDLLNTKAELLNRISNLTGFALYSSDSSEKVKVIRSLCQMLIALGIPTQTYGIEIQNGKLILPKLPAEPSNSPESAVKSNPIGYLLREDASTPDLPDGLHRSIGFASHAISGEAPPARQGGKIRISGVQGNSDGLVFSDDETRKSYVVDINVFRAMGAGIDGHELHVEFNQSGGEWVVVDKNLNNPSGKIGFLNN